jgi:adenylate cyclase
MLKAFSGDESEPQSTAHTDASGVSAMLSAFGDAENGIDSANDTKVSDTSEMLSAFSDVGSESQSTADAEASDTLEVLSAFDDAESESEASDAAKGFGDSKPNQEVSETESTAVSTELVNTSEGIGASPSYLIQDSLDKALVPLKKIQRNLLLISIGAIAIGVGFSLMIAIGVTSAVHQLVRGTEEVINGNYRYQLNITQHDEIGQLADHFNTMVVGLRDKEKIRAVIDKVVSKEVAEELLKGEVKLGGETRQCTVLFSDIRGWTTISERLQPEELVEMLNAYLTLMSSAIEDQSGVIDKYIGDAVVALFGAPVSHPDAIQQSVDAAFEMRRRLAAWNVERKKNGEFPLETGIGINTGPVLAGNIGSETRLNYTVMGDTVNLAARLEGLTKLYGAGIIVSEALRNELGPEYLCRELDLIRVKGKTEAVHIFEVLAPDETGKLSQMVDRFEHALVYYRQQNWGGAEKAFIQTVGGFENDRASQLYVERIQHYRQFPPPPDWNSVFVATEKYGDDD